MVVIVSHADETLWQDVPQSAMMTLPKRPFLPTAYHLSHLNNRAFQANADTILLPDPNGRLQPFHLIPSPIMATELAAKFPQIGTWQIVAMGNEGVSGRLDFSPIGLHAIIHSPDGTWYIDPYSRQNNQTHISYYQHNYNRPAPFTELFASVPLANLPLANLPLANLPLANLPLANLPLATLPLADPSPMHTYRLALATTGEYTQYHGGTKIDGMIGVITAVNRINSIYEREAAVRLELVANNDQIIFTNPATDGYNNNDGLIAIAQNQAIIDNVIGSGNYDIGHLFSTNSGGLAQVGAICEAGRKAQATTGLSIPEGDPFYVDYVAHEIGHQFGATHTFNGDEGGCEYGRYAPTAYEPGSGSTIMGYAGLCGSQNMQLHSDPYFHADSLAAIRGYIAAHPTCGEVMGDLNAAPVISSTIPSGLTIPANTPFILSGTATDPDGDDLTYAWEQMDAGAPLFRSFTSVIAPTRTFPRLETLLGDGAPVIGEQLPTTTRTLHFRLTARDNRGYPTGGAVAMADVAFNVEETAGPFTVLQPETAVLWSIDIPQEIRWMVAGTNQPPVNCTHVQLSLSQDGGWTFPAILAVHEPNDGAAMVQFEEVTGNGRVKVACEGNIFFALSEGNFMLHSGETQYVYLPIVVK